MKGKAMPKSHVQMTPKEHKEAMEKMHKNGSKPKKGR